LDHALRHVALHGKDILHVAVIGFGPEMITIGHIHQLGRDPKFLASFTYTAL